LKHRFRGTVIRLGNSMTCFVCFENSSRWTLSWRTIAKCFDSRAINKICQSKQQLRIKPIAITDYHDSSNGALTACMNYIYSITKFPNQTRTQLEEYCDCLRW
jgi:hypothetical protein